MPIVDAWSILGFVLAGLMGLTFVIAFSMIIFTVVLNKLVQWIDANGGDK